MSLLRSALPALLCPLAVAVEVEAAKIATADAAPLDPGAWELALGGTWSRSTRTLDADGTSADRGGALTALGAGVGLTYGIADGLDAGVGLGWDRVRDRAVAAGDPDSGSGPTDLELAAKWRWAEWGDEEAGLAAALLPSVTVPMGRDHDDSAEIATASPYWTAGLLAAVSGNLGRLAVNADAGASQAFGADRDGYRGAWVADVALGWQFDGGVQPAAELSWARDRQDGGDAPWLLTGTLGVQVAIPVGRLGLGVQRDLAGRSADLATAGVADLAIAF